MYRETSWLVRCLGWLNLTPRGRNLLMAQGKFGLSCWQGHTRWSIFGDIWSSNLRDGWPVKPKPRFWRTNILSKLSTFHSQNFASHDFRSRLTRFFRVLNTLVFSWGIGLLSYISGCFLTRNNLKNVKYHQRECLNQEFLLHVVAGCQTYLVT